MPAKHSYTVVAKGDATVDDIKTAAPAAVALPVRAKYFNRELSWLAFNARVLEEADNAGHPLLERLRFLSISANNLDEFYMVRVAGLRGQVAPASTTPSQDGLTPAQQLAAINRRTRRADARAAGAAGASCAPSCAAPASPWSSRTSCRPEERHWLDSYFLDQIFPVLTPLAIDPAHPFPFIPNLGFALALELRRARTTRNMLRALLPLPPQIAALRPAARARTIRFIAARGHGRPLPRPAVPRLRGRRQAAISA